MKEIEIFKIEGLMRDGGSINAIYTNIGIFSRRKKIGNRDNKNGFYDSERNKVDEQLTIQLESALDSFFAEKQEKYKQSKLKEAIETLTKALKEDGDYRRSWSANIAMSYKDETSRWLHNNRPTFKEEVEEEVNIHEIANNAAENFLDLLCSAGKE